MAAIFYWDISYILNVILLDLFGVAGITPEGFARTDEVNLRHRV